MNDASQDKTLFGVVAEGLEKFRMEVEGDSGEKIRAIKGQKGPIPDLIRGVLDGLEKALTSLYKDVVVKIEPYLISFDATVAALEVTVYSLKGVGGELQFGKAPELLGLPAEPFQNIGEGIGQASKFMGYGLDIAHLLPRPEELGEARTTLEKLLLESNKVPGSLVQLLNDIRPSASG